MAHQSRDFARPVLPRDEKGRRIAAILLVAFSVTTTLAGLLYVVAFDNTPAVAASSPITWPIASHLKRAAGRSRLLVFAHPYCACTAATITELATLMPARTAAGIPDITFVFYRPAADTGWSWKSLKDRASGLPHSEFIWDNAGRESRRFGATTSGTVLLYDARGNLRFLGGITGSRGHEGDNYGLDALRAALTAPPDSSLQPAPIARSRVFGCALGSVDSDPGNTSRLPAAFTDWFTTLGRNVSTILHRNA